MSEYLKEIVKTSVLNDNPRTYEVLQDLYFNHMSSIPLIKGIKRSDYFHFSKDLVNIKKLTSDETFSLKNLELHPYTLKVLKANKNINLFFNFERLDRIQIENLEEEISEYYHFIEAVMLARIIEREERKVLISIIFAIIVPLATLVLGIVSLILSYLKLVEVK